MTVTPEVKAEILRIYNANPKRFSAFRTAKTVGVGVAEVTALVASLAPRAVAPREHNGGRGRDTLQDFIVARRKRNQARWDNADEGVKLARRRYIAGTHTMATHYDGDYVMLCSIPLSRPQPPLPDDYFPGA